MEPRIEVTVHASPGLGALCREMQDAVGIDILELGPVRSSNIDFWSRYESQIYVADLRSSLPLPPLEEDREYQESEWSAILNLPAGRYFDVIFVWDLLSYMDENAIPGFIAYVNRYCKPGTMMFAMIIDQAQMPVDSNVFRIVDENHLGYERSDCGSRSCPRLQPRVLENMMLKFRTTDSYRLRHGIIEYLFTYEG